MYCICISEKDTIKSRRELFKLPGYAGVCITYCITSIVQYGTIQWGPVYLVNDLGHSMVTGIMFSIYSH